MGWPVEGSSWSIYPILPAVLVGNEAFSLTGIKRTTRSSHHALVLPRARAEKFLRQGRGLRAFTKNVEFPRWRKLSSIGTTGRPGRSAPHTSGRSLSRPVRFHAGGAGVYAFRQQLLALGGTHSLLLHRLHHLAALFLAHGLVLDLLIGVQQRLDQITHLS